MNSNIEELKGKRIAKQFSDGTYFGTVVDFDPKSSFYEVSYDDGDKEEMDLEEIRCGIDMHRKEEERERRRRRRRRRRQRRRSRRMRRRRRRRREEEEKEKEEEEKYEIIYLSIPLSYCELKYLNFPPKH